jgi:pSer/pThr/pTyr-binding forkhead associated (FHA) protein
MPDALLNVLKLLLLALLYLFFFRVLRAVWTEISARPLAAAPAAPVAAARPRAGTAATPAQLRLKVVEGDTKGKTYDLGDELTVGRAAGCQVALADDTVVSQLHARLFRKEGRYFVEDLGSTNGTFLNRKQVSAPVALRRGDRLQVGKTVFEVAK